MFRKLIALALLAAGIAAAIKKSQESGTATSSPEPFSGPAQPAAGNAEDLAEVREGQTQDTVESPVVGADGEEAVIPDVSDDDPLVRQEEKAAAAEAREVGGGEPESLPPDLDPELEPVVEASGDDPETLEREVEEEGR